MKHIQHVSIGAVAVLFGLLTGCAQQKFGGLPCDITLDAKGGPADAYVIPYGVFKQDPTVVTDNARLTQYYRGKTPTLVHLDPVRWVYVVRQNGILSPPETFKANDFIDGTLYPYKPE